VFQESKSNAMRKFTSLMIILQPFFSISSGQFIEKHNLNFKNSQYDVFIVKADSNSLKKIKVINNDSLLTENDFFESLSNSLNQNYFAITASIVDSLCMPLGLFISEAIKIRNINLGSGNGNFYLKPNGLIYVDSLGDAALQESGAFNSKIPYKLALQSGPMLISNNTFNPAFDKNSKNKNLRCGVGLMLEKNEKYLVFIKTIVPVSFYQFAEIFSEKYKCINALNLESSWNSSMHLPTLKVTYSSQVRVCRYLVMPL
jgi:uncharacterized protein YigE (DUF2233 family)